MNMEEVESNTARQATELRLRCQVKSNFVYCRR